MILEATVIAEAVTVKARSIEIMKAATVEAASADSKIVEAAV